MKFLIILLFCTIMQLQASLFSQQMKVTVEMNNVSLEKLFEELSKQANIDFLYNYNLVNKKGNISINVQEKELSEVLKDILENKNLEYVLLDNVIIIRETSNSKTNFIPQNTRKVKGTVTTKNGEPLPGVTVIIKGTSIGLATDIDGKFNLEFPSSNEVVLIFSFIGMKTQEIELDNKTELNIIMEENPEEIDEVVITGYQVIDKRMLTSSISKINIDQLEKMGSLTIDQMLEGKVPGLMITKLSAQPGAAAKVRVRSTGTFTGSREPLWVIDGVIYEDPVPLSAADINSLDNVNLIGNAITGINPHDIESINILKDASATAIYGTRAANGVIVISTKRGKSGNATLSYSGSLDIVDRPKYSNFNLMNSKERIDVSREIYKRKLVFPGVWPDNTNLRTPLAYEKAILEFWENGNFNAFQNEVTRLEKLNYNWFKEFYRPAVNHSHSINVSGGTDNARYYFSIGYDKQVGTEKGVDLTRVTARSNIDINLRKNLLLYFGIDGSYQKAKYNHSSFNAFNEAYYTSRAVEARDDDNNLVFLEKLILQTINANWDNQFAKYNPVHERLNSRQNIQNNAFNFNVGFDWDVIKGIKWTSRFFFRNTVNLTEEWMKENTFYIAKLRSFEQFNDDIEEYLLKGESVVPFGGLYSGGQINQLSLNIRNQLNLIKVIKDDHVFNLNITQEATSTKHNGISKWDAPGYNHDQGRKFIYLPNLRANSSTYTVEDYTYTAMLKWFSGQINGHSAYPTITEQIKNSISWLGIFTYSYRDKYVLNFNIRSEGSNTFGQYERYKFRPSWSVSGRWNLHKEKFLVTKDIIDEIALKASYGFRGTSPNASPYLLLRDFGQQNSIYYPEYTSKLDQFPNGNLKWEKTQTLNFGIEFSFLRNKLNGTVDYAYSKSTDLLLTRPISLVNGVSTELYNAGSKDDHTVEFNIIGRVVNTKDFRINLNLNYTHIKENVLKGNNVEAGNFSVDKYLDGSIIMKGFPIDGFYSYRFNGLDEEGKPMFNGMDEDYFSYYEQLKDMLVYEGNRMPKSYGGFGAEIRYKNINLSSHFTYKIGYKVRLLDLYRNGSYMPLSSENMNREFIKRWKQAGDEKKTSIPGLSDNAYLIDVNNDDNKLFGRNVRSLYDMYDLSDIRTAKGDHIRWQTLTLSYNLNDELLKKLGLGSTMIRFQVQNLAVWSFDKKIRKNQDPEQIRNIGIPTLPSYNLGLSISF